MNLPSFVEYYLKYILIHDSAFADLDREDFADAQHKLNENFGEYWLGAH